MFLSLALSNAKSKPNLFEPILAELSLYILVYKNIVEVPTHEIRTIRIGNHEFRTYNLTINDGLARKTLVFIISPLGFNYNTNSSLTTNPNISK